MNSLVKKSSQIFFGSAIAGAGFSLGKDAYRYVKKNFVVIVALALILFAVIMPFFTSSNVFRWHQMSKVKWLFLIFVPWHALTFLASMLTYYICHQLNVFLVEEQVISVAYSEAIIIYYTLAVTSVFYLLGLCDAIRRRRKRKIVAEIERYNAAFMDEIGLIEIDGGKSITHQDSDGNMLRLESIGQDVIEFFVVGKRNKRTFIEIDSEGRFINYLGIV